MNLVIDKGNTCTKAAVFDSGKLCALRKTECLSESFFEPFYSKFPIDKAILSSVSNVDDWLCGYLSLKSKFLFLSYKTPVPVEIAYGSPETLGCDRIAAVVGANAVKPNADFIVIDCGTCITYEVFWNGRYLGGNISPGVEMRFKALHDYTDRLPKEEMVKNVPFVGGNTDTAILAGVQNGILFEMDGFISTMMQEYGDFTVFLTGGNAVFFEKRLKNPIFAVENLVLIGLDRILDYNA